MATFHFTVGMIRRTQYVAFALSNFSNGVAGASVAGATISQTRQVKKPSPGLYVRYKQQGASSFDIATVYADETLGVADMPVSWAQRGVVRVIYDYELRSRTRNRLVVSGTVTFEPEEEESSVGRPPTSGEPPVGTGSAGGDRPTRPPAVSANRGRYPTGPQTGINVTGGPT